MRLYSLTGAMAVEHDGVHYEPAEDGAFDFPLELSTQLLSSRTGSQQQWESDSEHLERLTAERISRIRVAAASLAADKDIVRGAEISTSTSESVPADDRAPVPPAAG